jgi:hypothetical protein
VFVGYGSPAGKPLEALYSGEYEPTFARLYEAAENGTLDNLTVTECFDAYAATYHTRYGSVILLSDDN